MGFISHTHHENGVTGVLCFHLAPQGKGKGKGPKVLRHPLSKTRAGFIGRVSSNGGFFQAKLWQLYMAKIRENY